MVTFMPKVKQFVNLLNNLNALRNLNLQSFKYSSSNSFVNIFTQISYPLVSRNQTNPNFVLP